MASRRTRKKNGGTAVASRPAAALDTTTSIGETDLFVEVRSPIEASRQHVARVVNSAMVLTYWRIGERVGSEILSDSRAGYGEQVVDSLAERLTGEYGSGFSKRNLLNMIRVARAFPNGELVQTLSGQLGWSHLVTLAGVEDPLAREYYAGMCATERWSVRTLQEKIQGMLFERTAISRKPEALVVRELAELREQDQMSADLVFRDHYVLNFLGLNDDYTERDLEDAILREMERFISELGSDFAFVARQKRITVDNTDYRLDLLFFHRRIRRLIAIELKLGRFQASDKGQMELYLRWLEKYERLPGEGSPLGLILCAGKSDEHVELLQLESSGIRVAEYLTELPSRPMLKAKLHAAIRTARQKVENRIDAVPVDVTPAASAEPV